MSASAPSPLGILVPGQLVVLLVEDVIDAETLIVSLNGRLIRVKNLTGQKFSKGKWVHLRVKGLEPLELEFFSPYRSSQRGFERFG